MIGSWPKINCDANIDQVTRETDSGQNEWMNEWLIWACAIPQFMMAEWIFLVMCYWWLNSNKKFIVRNHRMKKNQPQRFPSNKSMADKINKWKFILSRIHTHINTKTDQPIDRPTERLTNRTTDNATVHNAVDVLFYFILHTSFLFIYAVM